MGSGELSHHPIEISGATGGHQDLLAPLECVNGFRVLKHRHGEVEKTVDRYDGFVCVRLIDGPFIALDAGELETIRVTQHCIQHLRSEEHTSELQSHHE